MCGHDEHTGVRKANLEERLLGEHLTQARMGMTQGEDGDGTRKREEKAALLSSLPVSEARD